MVPWFNEMDGHSKGELRGSNAFTHILYILYHGGKRTWGPTPHTTHHPLCLAAMLEKQVYDEININVCIR